MGTGRGVDPATNRWDAGVESERRKMTSRVNKSSTVVGGAHASRQPSVEKNPLTQQKVKTGEDVKVSDVLHEKERGDGMVEKEKVQMMALEREASDQAKFQTDVLHEKGRCEGMAKTKEEKMMVLEGVVSVQAKAQIKETESMTWEKDNDQRKKVVMDEKAALASGLKSEQASPIGMEIESGPLAMIYEEAKGWSAETLGLNSRHWKRLAREVKTESKCEEKGPKCLKREGPTPLCELDPKGLDVKRRKEGRNEGKLIRRGSNEENEMVGGEVVAARQHRRAS